MLIQSPWRSPSTLYYTKSGPSVANTPTTRTPPKGGVLVYMIEAGANELNPQNRDLHYPGYLALRTLSCPSASLKSHDSRISITCPRMGVEYRFSTVEYRISMPRRMCRFGCPAWHWRAAGQAGWRGCIGRPVGRRRRAGGQAGRRRYASWQTGCRRRRCWDR